ncbi:sensor histidine kinase [Microbacterium sp. SORGH_AS_0862]|uniref:sensor histidine kinase n=1 Tax=Microbacterium sp. SORGH_AS_0862 TaxID=3041789 RepID=UPI00279151D2|nr:sensor histidine kinase [Microbacterium sp. SORGH_AS_0862]MDQ1205202.1 signal transduction histidine kinase [Microbacterium sp. SORGH_AS_0862]
MRPVPPSVADASAGPFALLDRWRTRVIFAAIMCVATLAQVLVTPISALVDTSVAWTLPLSPAVMITALTLGCMLQSASLALSARHPVLALTATIAAYVALLFVTNAPMWLAAMQLVIVLALFLVAARATPVLALGWAALITSAIALVWVGWTMTLGENPAHIVAFLIAEITRFALLAFSAAALGIWWHVVVSRADRARRGAEAVEREHEERIEQARAAERARIAQELHDVAGQHLAGLITLADAALKMAPAHPADALELVEDVRAEGRFAAASLASALQDLRAVDSGPIEVTRDLRQTAELIEFWRARGADVRLVSTAHPDDLPAVVSTTAYRVIAESLTNAAKYAPGARVEVTVGLSEGVLEISVVNAPGPDDAERHPGIGLGWGLTALGDRAELLGGSLTATTTSEGGWHVRTRLPVALVEA